MERKVTMQYTEQDFVETAQPQTLALIAKARELARRYAQTDYSDAAAKRSILTELLGKIGDRVEIDAPFRCDYGKNIFIGSDVIINMNCTFVDNSPITIGDRVLIAPNVQIYTAGHPILPQERLAADWLEKGTPFFRTYAKPVRIEDGVWIGGGAILLPGVTVGRNSVIGAGSVVNRSIPENCVAAGNPCRVVRRLDPEETAERRTNHGPV